MLKKKATTMDRKGVGSEDLRRCNVGVILQYFKNDAGKYSLIASTADVSFYAIKC